MRTARESTKCNHGVIKSILSNEKYKDDALLQKSYTVDYLTKKKKKNEGEIPQYYVKDNHEAIISKETFERVQRLLEKRLNFTGKYSSVTIFSSRIKCGCCGGYYGSKVWYSTSKYKRKIWQCNEKFKNDERCTTPHLTEEEIKEVFVKAVNSLIKRKKAIIKEGEHLIESVLDTTEPESKRATLEDKIATTVENINLCISENSKKIQNQEEYENRYKHLVAEYESLQEELNDITQVILDKQVRKDEIQGFIKTIKDQDEIAEFNDDLWCNTINCIVVNSDKTFIVKFQDGSDVKIER